MQLTIAAKQPGRKHPLIAEQIIEIQDIGLHPTVRNLISAVVTQQVEAYINKPNQKSLLAVLDTNTIDNQAATGKVGFNVVYNNNKPDLHTAIQTAIQAFEDGLFAVFAGDIQHEKSDDIISLEKNTVVTFIRLTFLAGSYW